MAPDLNAGENSVPWLELGVNPDDVDRTLAADVKGFLSRLHRTLLERAFVPAGLGAVAAMSDAEAVQLIAKSAAAGYPPVVRALRRLALCHRLVSGKREDALALVEDAVARLDPPVLRREELLEIFESRPGAPGVPLRERHVMLAFELCDRAPDRLSLFPLLDRASRVSYRAYLPERDGWDGRSAQLGEAVSRLTDAYVRECIRRAFGRDGAGSPRVEGVVRLGAERIVFMSVEGADRIVATTHGAIVASDVESMILRFSPEGRLDAHGDPLAVRVAERLLAPDGGVRYVAFQPKTSQHAAASWLRSLLEGGRPEMNLESATLDFASFQAHITGDVAGGMRALETGASSGGVPPVERIRTLTLSYRPPTGSSSRFTFTIEPGGGRNGSSGTVAASGKADGVPLTLAITYRATSAGLAARRSLETLLGSLEVYVSPR